MNEPETDLVRIAEREVIERVKVWASTFARQRVSLVERHNAQRELLAAVTLLESRETLCDDFPIRERRATNDNQ